MRCGKGHDHGSVAEVKACYGVGFGSLATATLTRDFRPNKFAGTCVLCGAKVGEGEGRIDRKDSGSGWNVSHLSGECPERTATDAAPLTSDGRGSADFSAVPGGYYATASATGNNDLDFWYVTEGTRNPAIRFVKRVIGGSGNERVHRSTALAALSAILAAGTDKSGLRFASELGRCRKCGKHLTDETSRALGIGPKCRAGSRD